MLFKIINSQNLLDDMGWPDTTIKIYIIHKQNAINYLHLPTSVGLVATEEGVAS